MFRSITKATSKLKCSVGRNQTLRSLSPGEGRLFSSTDSSGNTSPYLDSFGTSDNDSSSTNDVRFEKVAFLGAGKIAQAIISPLIKTGLQPAEKIAIFDVSINAMKHVQANHEGIVLAQSISELVDGADLCVCAVKPQNMTEGLCNELKKANIPENATFLSVIAGLPLNTYHATGYKKIVRSMPNTPAMIG